MLLIKLERGLCLYIIYQTLLKRVPKKPKSQTIRGDGPRQKMELPLIGGQLEEDRCKEVIYLMNHTSDSEIILQR